MQGMSGLELQRQVNLSDSSVPVIFVTAHDDKANRQLAMDAGASEVFQKPFSANAFLTAVGTALKNSADRPSGRARTE
jgi:FixJ family two-component response regulator